MHYQDSITTLQQLLFSGPPPDAKEEESGIDKKNIHCYITKRSQNISNMGNGVE